MSYLTIGTSVRRIDAGQKVTGRALYPADRSAAGMCHAGVIFAGRPRARIREIDASAALALDGVRAVLTAADVPHNVCGLLVPDQPVLCADLVHHAGDKVAVVVADTPELMQQARRLVRIDYEDLPPLTDPARALLPDAPLVHPERADNLIAETRFGMGDVAAGFAAADVIVEGVYQTGAQEHAFLDPEAGLAYVAPDGSIVVETAGQWAHDDRRQIAAALGLPEERVRVIYRAIGGAFGGREDVSVQIVLALAAFRLGIPVKMVWTRQESMAGHHKRHPITYRARLGATRAGKLVAAEISVLADGGAYASTSMAVLANAMLFSTGPYVIPHVSVSGQVVYTNNLPCGAMRGFGALQGNFCAEMLMARLAARLGLDPVALRAANLVGPGATLPNGSALPAGVVGAHETLERAAHAAGWTWHDGDRTVARPGPAAGAGRMARGRGFACGWKNVGLGAGVPDLAQTVVELHGATDIERAVVRNAAADVGQGVQTVIVQVVAEVLGLPMERIEVIGADTGQSPQTGTASASRLTVMVGNATIRAAQEALARWRAEERPAIGRGRYEAPETHPLENTPPAGQTHYSLGYTAGCAEVSVDLDTGQVRLESFVSALDAGQAINPDQVEGQTHGSITQAIGWTLSEKLVLEEGRLLTPDLATYLVPTTLDVPPRMQCIIVENPDPHGPFGARGIGELPMLTVAPAILAAIHDATGVWLDRVPALSEDVWRALRAARGPQTGDSNPEEEHDL